MNRRGPALAAGEAHVWLADLDRDGRGGSGLLSREERRRAAAILDPIARRRWAASRRALRTVLSLYEGIAPDALTIVAEPGGKPRLDGGRQPEFSLSHSAGAAMIGVSRGRIGVDLERVDPGRDLVRLAERALDAATSRRVRECRTEAERARVFYSGWTRREAVGKCWGMGLGEPVPSGASTLASLEVNPGWAAALAVAGELSSVRSFRVSTDS